MTFGFVDTLGWMIHPMVTCMACTFLALEAIGDEIEEPFGNEPNDLPLTQMTAMIENTLLEMDGRGIKIVLVLTNGLLIKDVSITLASKRSLH